MPENSSDDAVLLDEGQHPHLGQLPHQREAEGFLAAEPHRGQPIGFVEPGAGSVLYRSRMSKKLLAVFEGTPLDMDMRSVLAKIAESLEPEWLGEHVSVLAEDRIQVDPALRAQAAGFLERRESFRADYQTFAGTVPAYELDPLHLLAYHGN